MEIHLLEQKSQKILREYFIMTLQLLVTHFPKCIATKPWSEIEQYLYILLRPLNIIVKTITFVLQIKDIDKTRLKNMLVCCHPGLFFRVHPASREKKLIILRWKR